MLKSAAPALHMAPLYLRSLYRAMQQETGWAALVPRLGAKSCSIGLKTWLQRGRILIVCGDASSVGYAAYTPHGEIEYAMVMSFDQVTMDCMQAGSLSSVYCETKNARLAMGYVVRDLGSAALAGIIFVIIGDRQPAIQDLQVLKTKGTADDFPPKSRRYNNAATHDFHVDSVWQPRTRERLQHADELSRLPDSSEVFLR